MKKVKLGRTNLEVSLIGFGGIPIQRLTEAEAIRVVQRTLDLGVTFIDTANGYTTSEERIGAAIAGRRDQVVIATKSGASDRATALEHLDLSLKRLNTDHIDLWQFHGINNQEKYDRIMAPDGAMEAFQAALQAGKVCHIGFSSHSLDMALRLVPTGLFETVQFPFNFVISEPANGLLPLAREHDLGFIAMKPMAGGLLDKANLVFKYLLRFEGIVPDPGIEKTEEIEEIIGIVNGPWALTPTEQAELEQTREELGTRFCRRCQYCQPCPQGISIHTVLNTRSFWKRMPPERFFGERTAQTTAKAEECLECGECEAKCPYNLPIREMLSENVEFYKKVQAGWQAAQL